MDVTMDQFFADQLHPATIEVLNRYNPVQQEKIFSFFNQMMANFSNTFAHIYGDEPDESFAQFACDLTQEEALRIVEHLKEQLALGNTWPPHIASLSVYKWKPLEREIRLAKHNLCTLKKPTNRVEKFIFGTRRTELLSISDKGSDRAFEKLYIRAYQDVMDGLDEVMSSKRALGAPKDARTEMDRRVDERLKSGNQLPSGFAKIFDRVKSHNRGDSK